MKTYRLGTVGDRVVTVKKLGGEHVVTFRRKDCDTKYIELPPKRQVFITRHSLVRAKGEVFVLLYVFFCFFARSTISRQPAGRFTPKFACGRTLVPDVSSPLLGVSGLRRTEKGEMKFSLLWESMGNFCILAIFSDIQQRVDGSTQNFICVETMSADVPLPLWVHRPLEDGRRGS